MDCRSVPKAEVDRIEGLMRLFLKGWCHHIDFEDLMGMARLQFWAAMSQHGDRYWYLRDSLLRICCRQAARRFLTASENRTRKETRHGTPIPLAVDLAVLEEPHRARPTPGDHWMRVVEPDFSPQVIRQIWAEQVWTEAMALLDEEEQQTIHDWIVDGIQFGKVNQHKLARCQRLLNRYRHQVGVPLLWKGGFARKNWDHRAAQKCLTEEQRQASYERKKAKARARYHERREEEREKQRRYWAEKGRQTRREKRQRGEVVWR